MAQRPPINRALSLAAALRRRGKTPARSTTAPPHIEGIAFSTATIRSGGMAVATLTGSNLQGADVHCESLSSGFIIDVLPHHTVQAEGGQLVLAMRVFRRMGTPRALCLVRVGVGVSSAVGSITVRV